MDNVSPRPRDYWTLAAIVLLATVIRVVGLTRESLWYDELFTATGALLNSPGDVISFLAKDVHPPGHLLAVWAWVQVLGESEFALRLFSVLGGVLLVPAVFRLGRQLFDVRTGLVSAFISAILIQGVYYSQEARANIWIALFSAVAASLAIDYIRSRKPWALAGLVLVSIANFYFHYFGALFSVLLFAGLVWQIRLKKGNVWPVVFAGAVPFLAFLPWLPVALGSATRSYSVVTGTITKAYWFPRPNAKSIAEIVNIYYGPGYVLDLLALVALVAGFLMARRKARAAEKSAEKWLVLWILVPLTVAVVVSFVVRPIYLPRNMFLGFAAASILLARALQYVAQSSPRIWPVAIALAIAHYGLHFATGKGYFVSPTKQQVRELAQFIAEHNSENLPIWTSGHDKLNLTYYLRGTKDVELLRWVDEDELKEKGMANVATEPRFWIASSSVNINELEDISQNFEIEQSRELFFARAYLVRRKQ